MFVGTSICGAMPSLAWNVGMCFMMGVAAGGMLPVTYALLAEMMPSKHRGWALVLVGGLGAVGGYFAASGFSALLQPFFGWRILWILNLPTGLSLVLLGTLIPESAKFLLARGRREEARRVMERFGSKARTATHAEEVALSQGQSVALTGRAFFGKLVALSLAAICFSLINFGLLLWLPADLVAKGYSVAVSSKLLAESALIAFPTIFLVALAYSRWSRNGPLLAPWRSPSLAWWACSSLNSRGRQSRLAGRAADHRHERVDCHAPALCRGKFSAPDSRPDHGDGCRLYQGRRNDCPVLAILALVPPLAAVSIDDHGADRRPRLCWSPGSARKRAGATCATSTPTATPLPRPAFSVRAYLFRPLRTRRLSVAGPHDREGLHPPDVRRDRRPRPAHASPLALRARLGWAAAGRLADHRDGRTELDDDAFRGRADAALQEHLPRASIRRGSRSGS